GRAALRTAALRRRTGPDAAARQLGWESGEVRTGVALRRHVPDGAEVGSLHSIVAEVLQNLPVRTIRVDPCSAIVLVSAFLLVEGRLVGPIQANLADPPFPASAS